MSDAPLLALENVEAGYGRKPVLRGVSIHVRPGEIVGLIGPNGAGKSTILKVTFGLLKAWSGRVIYRNCEEATEIQNRSSAANVRDGICYVPQGNRVFTDMTVRENLEIAGCTLRDRAMLNERIEQALDQLELRGRESHPASHLSGGTRQRLALAAVILRRPKLLLVDEPSLGLAPRTVEDAFHRLRSLNEEYGTTMLIVEQNVKEVLRIAQRVYVLKLGQVALEDEAGNLRDSDVLRRVFLT